MTDNVASCFCLASLYFILTNRIKTAGLLCGLACATRYMIWGPSLGLVLALAFLQRKNPKILRVLFGFCLLAALGPLPNMIRNYFLNGGNPFFPVFLNLFGQGSLNYEYGYSWHGRGKDIVSFLLLPYDFLYTNTFVNGFFDYTVGKLFYIQLLVGVLFAPFFFWNRLKVNSNAWKSEGAIACLIFFVVYLLYWFFSSQQMRFFIPALVLINIGMFYVVYKLGQKTSQIGSLKFQINSMWILSALICLSILSVRSIQADSFQILRTGQTPSYEPLLTEAKECLSKIAPNSHVGFTGRGIVGFFDFETYLIPPVGYALNLPREKWPKPEYIFGGTYNLYPEYAPWPAEKPCMYKLK